MNVRTRGGGGDQVDAANLLETLASPGFTRIQERIRKMRGEVIEQLVTAPVADVPKFQGWIQAIDRVLDVPKILRAEDAAKRKSE